MLTIYAGDDPGPLSSRLHGTSISAVILFVVFTAGGLWVMRTASGSAWRWATGIGLLLATAQLLGSSLRRFDSLVHQLVTPSTLAWTVVHWFGIAWLTTCGLAALIGPAAPAFAKASMYFSGSTIIRCTSRGLVATFLIAAWRMTRAHHVTRDQRLSAPASAKTPRP